MPMVPLVLRPGINSQITPTLNEGGYTSGTRVRFRDGLPQPMGGWTSPVVSSFQGVCRGMAVGSELTGVVDVGIGTHLRLYILQGGVYNDVTPITSSGSLSGPFGTVSGSRVVTVSHAGHGRSIYDWVRFVSGPYSGGGVIVSGEYYVATVVDANSYTISASSTATGTTAFGVASSFYQYLLPVGNQINVVGFGWGAGTWGATTWGTARTTTGAALPARVWTIDNWGQDMLACPRNGGVYQWVAASGVAQRAITVTNAPTANKAIVVGVPERHLIVLGAEVGGTQDPLLVRWSDVESLTIWTATTTNSAGSLRVAGGTKLVNGKRSGQQILLWTDAVLYAMQFTGSPYYYSFRQLGTRCGLIAPHAAVDDSGTSFWMSIFGFHAYRGGIQKLDCTIWFDVFNNLNLTQLDLIHCGTNAAFNEIAWFFPSSTATECDSIAVYNTAEKVWYGGIGWIQRTSWVDADVLTKPLATDASATSGGYVYQHEVGVDANGSGMNSTLVTGYFDIAEGQDFTFLSALFPDMQSHSGPVTFTFVGRNTAAADAETQTSGPHTITPSTPFIEPRLRARQMQIIIQCNQAGAFYRLGKPRMRMQTDGRNG